MHVIVPVAPRGAQPSSSMSRKQLTAPSSAIPLQFASTNPGSHISVTPGLRVGSAGAQSNTIAVGARLVDPLGHRPTAMRAESGQCIEDAMPIAAYVSLSPSV